MDNIQSNYIPVNNEDTPIVMVNTRPCKREMYNYFYSVFHVILSIFALYLSFRCNKEFNVFHFVFALFCPLIYILFIVATKGSCGLIPGERM